MADSNVARKEWMAGDAEARVAAMTEAVNAEKDKVNAWFADQMEWANKLYDSYYKEHLLETLATKLANTLDSLDQRITASQDLADAANADLCDKLDAEQASLDSFNQLTRDNLFANNAALVENTTAAAQDLTDAS